MRDSVISLNFANSRGSNQIKARTFEVPGAGGFLMTEYAPGLERYYEIGKEIEVFDNPAVLIQKCRYYLANPRERDSIARAGYERTRQQHTYEHRLSELLAPVADRECHTSPAEINSIGLGDAVNSHLRNGRWLKLARKLLEIPMVILFGQTRGPRAARRLVFELSYRCLGKHTFTAGGLPGRMFPDL